MTIDQSIQTTKQCILEALNQSGLSICTMELIMENILHAVHKQAEETLIRAEAGEEGDEYGSDESNIHGSSDGDRSRES